MRIKCLSCEALARLAYLSAARSPHVVDVELVARGLHNRPGDLRSLLQEHIDAAQGRGYDAITLVYGLCGQATVGLAARDVPVVIPRAHDCITLFLGGRERYRQQFESYPGTFWYAQDYLERDDGSGSALSMGSVADEDLQAEYEKYVLKYGKDNADYLMEVMGAWQSHYRRAVYIEMGVGDPRGGEDVQVRARTEAARRGWSFERVSGDMVLVRRLLAGEWGPEPGGDFLVLQPGQRLRMTYEESIMEPEA